MTLCRSFLFFHVDSIEPGPFHPGVHISTEAPSAPSGKSLMPYASPVSQDRDLQGTVITVHSAITILAHRDVPNGFALQVRGGLTPCDPEG